MQANTLRVAVDWPEGQMPIDQQTGLPHAILLGLPDNVTGPVLENYHHHFFKRRDPDLEGDHNLTSEELADLEAVPLDVLAGFAVRVSRGQMMWVPLHNLAHRKYPIGPALPHTIDEKFVVAAKACAGIVSRWALDLLSPQRNQLVYMDDDTYNRVASPAQLCTERVYYDKPANHRRMILGNFFMRYAVSRDLSHVSPRVIDEFLSTKDDSRQLELGRLILREAMEVMIDPVLPDYCEMRAQGMVHPARPHLRAVVWKLVHPDRRDKVLPVLRQNLLAA